VGEGIAQLAQDRESPLHRGVDQPQTASEGDLGTERTQGPIRQEKAITTKGCRGHQGLKQVLKGGIDPGDTHQDCSATALFEHLQGNSSRCLGPVHATHLRLFTSHLIHPSEQSLTAIKYSLKKTGPEPRNACLSLNAHEKDYDSIDKVINATRVSSHRQSWRQAQELEQA
jgi:hypothetical protein